MGDRWIATIGGHRGDETAGRRSRATALAYAIVAGTVVALVISMFVQHDLSDLAVYLRGGRAVTDHSGIYSFSIGKSPFTYPPFAAVLAALPAMAGLLVAGAAMTALSVISLGVIVSLAMRCARGLPWYANRGRAAVVCAVVFGVATWCEPSRISIWLGQVNLLLAALVMVDVLGSGKRLPRGALIGIAAGIKLTPGIFIVYLLLTRRFRAAVVAIASFAGTVVLGAVFAPTSSLRYWTHDLFQTSRIGDVASYGNQSLLAVARREIPGRSLGTAVWILASLVVLLAGLQLALRMHRTGRELLAVSVTGILSTLVSPVSWTHHWVWFIPLIVGLAAFVAERGWAARLLVVAMLPLVMLGPNKPAARAGFGWPAWRATVGNGYALAGVLVIGLLLAATCWPTGTPPGRRGPASAEPLFDPDRVGT